MIRPFRFESQRYGEVSRASESQYDHPFQWGSKRTGPDLAREGGRYPNLWHFRHLSDPRSTSPGSNMPPYAWMASTRLDLSRTSDKLRAMRTVGVPYTDSQIEHAAEDARGQAHEIARDLYENGAPVNADREIVALIAYLQRLGRQPEVTPAPAGTQVASAH
jgi:cytochrome c oxidase cbb3-type subunit I/II